MNNKKKIFLTIAALYIFLISGSSILTLFSNINSHLKKDNRSELIIATYEERITTLEKELSEYEKSMNSIEIYDKESFILAKIALRNVYEFINSITITTEYKVSKNDLVVNENGVVGVVDEVNNYVANIALITGNVKISANINDTYGVISNFDKRSKRFEIIHASDYQNIKIGDVVTTSGLDELPKGYQLGVVEDILKDGIDYKIYVKSSVDFDNLNYLMVVHK